MFEMLPPAMLMTCAFRSALKFSRSMPPWSRMVIVTVSRATISRFAIPKAPVMLLPSPQTELPPLRLRGSP